MSTTISLVTGANRGIGLNVAQQLAVLGHIVLLGCRRADAGRAAVQALRRAGGNVELLPIDVSDEESVRSACKEIEREYGRLDVLVNNAGINTDRQFEKGAATVAIEHVRSILEVNLLGVWMVTQALLPLLRRSEHPRIVNVSSRAGALSGMETGAPGYRVSKAALDALTRMLADELGDEGFLVNSVCPGRSATALVDFDGRPPEIGASGIVWAATLDDDGPNGGFFRDGEPLDW